VADDVDGLEIAAHLPFNRKERFFTGTVLPLLVASDDFARLPAFLSACGMPAPVIEAARSARPETIQFLTEYGFAESTWNDRTGDWTDYDGGRDTPDVVIVGTDWLLAVEAKVYARQGRTVIADQLAAQRTLVEYWQRKLDVPPEHARLVALLPEAYAREVGDVGAPVVTWEAVLAAVGPSAPAYWRAVLATALRRYDELKSTFDGRRPVRPKLTGAEIVAGHDDGSRSVTWVGRLGGLGGARLQQDLATGSWRTQTYEVSEDEPDNARNWFTVAEFVTAVRACGA
jgi:hypothetical protein